MEYTKLGIFEADYILAAVMQEMDIPKFWPNIFFNHNFWRRPIFFLQKVLSVKFPPLEYFMCIHLERRGETVAGPTFSDPREHNMAPFLARNEISIGSVGNQICKSRISGKIWDEKHHAAKFRTFKVRK